MINITNDRNNLKLLAFIYLNVQDRTPLSEYYKEGFGNDTISNRKLQ